MGKQHQRAVDAAWREALSNPDLAHGIERVGLKAADADATKMHAYLLTVGLL